MARIELRYDGPRIQQPVRLANKRELTVVAAKGFSPSVLFRPELDNVAGTKYMFELSGAHLSWEEIPVRLILPESDPGQGWAIFALKGGKSLDVSDSSLTIENRDLSGIVWHYNVSFFLLANADGRTMRVPGEDDRSVAHSRPAIRLQRCVVRGQANLLRMQEAAGFRLSWTDGLFASDQLMFDLDGAVDDRQVDGAMEVELTRVTARVPGGLARVNLAGQMFPVPLQLTMNLCIVLSEPSIPLVEHRGVGDRGVGDRDGIDRLLRMTGQRNVYPALWPEANNPPLWDRIAWSVSLPNSDPITISLSDEDPSWKDFGPGTIVNWVQQLPHTRPVDEHQPADYRVERTDTNPAAQAGFADDVLPLWP